MRFLLDAMLPPSTCGLLVDQDHEAITPTDLGAHSLSDDRLIETHGWGVVTDNAGDFVHATTRAVLLVRKDWCPAKLSQRASPKAWTARPTLISTRAIGPAGWTPTDDRACPDFG
jgi:hypothetical protein